MEKLQTVVIGERKTRFFQGAKFTFERVRRGEWKIIEGNSAMIPHSVIESLGD